MNAIAVQTFLVISQAHFAAICERIEEATGIVVNGSAGEASQHGVDISWEYSPASCALVVTVHKTPLFVSASNVLAKVGQIVEATQ